MCNTSVIPIRKGRSINQTLEARGLVACEANPEVHPISPQRVDATLTHGKLPLEKQLSKISWKNWSFLATSWKPVFILTLMIDKTKKMMLNLVDGAISTKPHVISARIFNQVLV